MEVAEPPECPVCLEGVDLPITPVVAAVSWSWPLHMDMCSHTVQQPSLYLSWGKTYSHRNAEIFSLLEHILDGKSRLDLHGPSWGLMRVCGISLCWVSFPFLWNSYKLLGAGQGRGRGGSCCTPHSCPNMERGQGCRAHVDTKAFFF